MHGRTSTARQASADGRPRRGGTAAAEAQPCQGKSRSGRPGNAARIPRNAASLDSGLAGQWPLRSFLELGAFPGAVPCARLHSR